MCGHWWDQPPGEAQYLLRNNWAAARAGWTPSDAYMITFVRCDDATTRVLGHSYSHGSNDD
jgi:hypothetical protein